MEKITMSLIKAIPACATLIVGSLNMYAKNSYTATGSAGGEYGSVSQFADSADSSLAITLLSFSANYAESENTVLIQWTVASQVNNKLFEVEKTDDGNTWTQVGTLQGAGTNSVTMNYAIADNAPVPGISYYRLRQMDDDGQVTIFEPVAVNIAPEQLSIQLFPNPVCSAALLHIYLPGDKVLKIVITDEAGRTINIPALRTCVMPGNNIIPLNTSSLSPGIYFLSTYGEDEMSSIKFIKK